MPKRHLIFHAVPVTTLVLLISIGLSGKDSGGDLPGILRAIGLFVSLGIWSLAFAVTMLVDALCRKRWTFLTIASLLLLARIAYFTELLGLDAADYMYVGLPLEYAVYYLAAHTDSGLEKFSFFGLTVVLFWLCFLAVLPFRFR